MRPGTTLTSTPRLHGLEHVDALLRVALSDLFECLVLVAALCDVLTVQDVVLGDQCLVLSFGEVGAQRLEEQTMTRVRTWCGRNFAITNNHYYVATRFCTVYTNVKNHLDNRPDKQHQLKRTAEDRKRHHVLVVNLAQERRHARRCQSVINAHTSK